MPVAFCKKVFRLFLALVNPDINTSQELLLHCFVWPNIHGDVRDLTRACILCQMAKIYRHNVTPPPLQRYIGPYERFSQVHLDLVGFLPASKEHTYLLTAICKIARHFEAILPRDFTAKSCADNFVLNWVARFRAPDIITTDWGRQFTNALWKELAEILGAKLSHTMSCHLASNSREYA